MINKELLDILACPACEDRPPVRLSEDEAWLVCDRCDRRYPIRDGIPIMLVDEAVLPDTEGQKKTD
ncbi:MAG: Trm112 family protein [Kiritimatiellaeota bacterium]|nr:Trm112 family protein [Kiritimatiellota bacterium]